MSGCEAVRSVSLAPAAVFECQTVSPQSREGIPTYAGFQSAVYKAAGGK